MSEEDEEEQDMLLQKMLVLLQSEMKREKYSSNSHFVNG